MPELTPPSDDLRRSFAAAMAEFRAEGRGHDHDHSVIGGYIRTRSGEWADDEAFRAFAASIRAEALEESPRPEGFVPATELWWVEGYDFLGRVAIRHRLTPRLLEIGGHIGYDVRPSARRRGHATEMLRQALGLARGLGIESALITCDVDNIGSRTVIERNGGILEDERAGKLRFWAPTG
ncbi:MAG: GNAT family N-acetyltransferase [Chloroflexota bacterium]